MKKITGLFLAAVLCAAALTAVSCEKDETPQLPSETAVYAETIADKSAPTYSKDEMIARINAAGYTGELLNYDYPEGENEEGILVSLMYANEARDDAITAFCFSSDEDAEKGLNSSASTAGEGKVCSLYGRWVLIGSREFVDSITSH